MDIRPDIANVERDGEILTVSPNDVRVGETIVIRPGEKIPLDGVVVEGSSSLDTVALTGESAPRDITVGDDVISGCVNVSGVVRARVAKEFGASTASVILDLVENASENKSRSEGFISRFAHVYTPIVVFAAITLAVIGPLASGDFAGNFATWLLRALTFLVVSCPCALVISVPLTFFGGIGGASRRGILIKGSNYLEALANAGVVVFDKTGTLTRGTFAVTAVHPSAIGETELLHLAAHVESFSTHPIAAALRDAYPSRGDGCAVSDNHEIAGQGITANVCGHMVAVGNPRLMETVGAVATTCEHDMGTVIHVAIDGSYAGHIVISDQVKEDSADAISAMVWGGGFLAQIGSIDFAGGNVVHISSGVSALVLCQLLGRREGYESVNYRVHNVPLVAIGAALLLFGWFGFNAGSALAANELAVHAFAATAIAAAAAELSWMLLDVLTCGKPTLVGASTGIVIGLVSITPGCGYVPLWAAFIIGFSASIVCFFAVSVIKKRFGYDDALDAFGCHGAHGALCARVGPGRQEALGGGAS